MCQLFEFSTSQSLNQVLGNATYRHDIRQIDFCRCRRGQFNLGLFGCFFQTLHSHRVGCQIRTFIVLKLLYQPVDDSLVKVVTTQVSITVGRQYFEHAATEFQDRNIKCTTTQVEHSHLHVFVGFVDTVSQSCCCRFIHNTFYIQTCNLSGFFRCLALRIGEIGRHCDNSFCYFLTQIIFGCLLHLLKNHGRDFLRCVVTSVNVHAGHTVVIDYGIRHA